MCWLTGLLALLHTFTLIVGRGRLLMLMLMLPSGCKKRLQHTGHSCFNPTRS